MANDVAVKRAIETGDVAGLQSLLAEDAARANALISWGKDDSNLTHPLHYVCDMLFVGTLEKGKELPLIEALIRAGDVERGGEAGNNGNLWGNCASLGGDAW